MTSISGIWRPSVLTQLEAANFLFWGRTCPPSETVARMRPHFSRLGITRLARQTGLDIIGIPCFAAFRPNSPTLANTQGKGIDDDAAMASAVMEAVEFAIAEEPQVEIVKSSRRRFRQERVATHDPRRLLPMGVQIPEDPELSWVKGSNLFTGDEMMVPLDAVCITPKKNDLPGICSSTNGLASGNTQSEAILHAMCELIERDAHTLWSARDNETRGATEVSPDAFHCDITNSLVNSIHKAGLTLKLFDQTSDIGIPTFMALIYDGAGENRFHFDIAAGYGCHPVSSRAAIRAITEAAQTRITNIAGSRDDFAPEEFEQTLSADLRALVMRTPDVSPAPTTGYEAGGDIETYTDIVLARLRDCGVNDMVTVLLGGAQYGISVVKLLCGGLEDREPNRNWRPGPRMIRELLRHR